ncbi:protein-tyrosine phosphatase [Caloramator quimbayensis]|uniref:protein-tyrosine-phosphatase n=1 Tax=Caloramator quimbayensis TaxID=1147123 RepID=A0A1T4XHR4_9CLOT|nr:CpsB/CapC family capsule biosynthesis tyrosine phosphatase [Caloramator quimbayensis]SKA88648.1 protein-tyrosine phosphatase [Caloramator quimbayensis]
MMDIHCHILPLIDDGPDSIETSIEMLKIAKREGIEKIIATPHYYKGVYEGDINQINSLTSNLNEISKNLNLNIQILKGQEVFLTRDLLRLFKNGTILTLNSSKYMLIELPFDILPKYALDIIYELRIMGIIPVIAHPERYSYVIEKPSTINDFIDEGCLFQINSSSITGDFGREIQRTSQILISHNICHFIASDAHSNTKRIPSLKKSFDISQKINSNIIKNVSNNEEMLTNKGQILQDVKKIKENFHIFNIFKPKW